MQLHETLDDGTEETKLYAPGYGNVNVEIPGIETIDLVYAQARRMLAAVQAGDAPPPESPRPWRTASSSDSGEVQRLSRTVP